MGYFSELSIQMGEQRLRLDHVEGKHICSRCFSDPHIANFIEQNVVSTKCGYCGRAGHSVAAANLTDVLEFMLPQIDLEYASADQSLPDDPETGERMFGEDEFDTRTMLEIYLELDLPRDEDGELMEDIAEAMPEQDWCLVDPLAARPEEAIARSWDHFKEVIMHRRRFFFLQHEDGKLAEDVSWGEAAFNIPDLLERIVAFTKRHGLIAALGSGSRWIRCQAMAVGDHDFSASRMGPPPYEFAKVPNRMSPAGVPMFYGAAAMETALAEISATKGRYAVGTFETLKDIKVLDLSVDPAIPSLFDVEFARDRAVARFMQAFIDDFRKPVDRTLKPHIDYLPTQVITEYFRTMVRTDDGEPVEGIRYRSVKNGQLAIVFFAENDDVLAEGAYEEGGPWLRMAEYAEIDHLLAE